MKLKTIVDSINTSMQATLNQEKFQRGIYYGLAKVVLKEYDDDTKKAVPVIYTDGKEIECSINDDYSFNAYHRCISLSQVPNPTDFGDGDNSLKETANMIMVVWGDSERMGLCQEDLASIMSASFPSEMTVSDISKVLVRVNNINIDSFALYSQEYKSTDYPLNPENYYFSIGYTVETTFEKSCVDKCCN